MFADTLPQFAAGQQNPLTTSGMTLPASGFDRLHIVFTPPLCRWWKDYSHRKNDEEDMVADSLLYDERCHLPRTTAGPAPEPEPEVTAAPRPETPPQKQDE